MSKRKRLKVIVHSDGRRIRIPSISCMSLYYLSKVGIQIGKSKTEGKANKYLRQLSLLCREDFKLLVDALPDEEFELVRVESDDDLVIIKII